MSHTAFPRPLIAGIVCATTAVFSANGADLPAKVTFNDHVLPILRNACLNCHNPDKKKAGLDLSTYQATLAGSDTGKVLESGNPGNSLLLKCVNGTEEPKMPPKGDRLTDNELAILGKWITGQLLETANSKGVAASNNVQLAVVSLDRPDGPPPMPGDLPLEPVVQPRANTAVVALAASPWAPLVAIGGQKQVILYHTETLQPLGVLPFPEGFPAVIRFSRNGQLLLTGGGLGGKSGQVALWDIKTGERAGSVGNEFDQVLGADLSPDHAHVALGGPSKILKIYSTKEGKLEHSIKKHTDWVTAVAFSPDGKYLASADRSGGIVVWEGATGKEFVTLPGHKVMVTSLAFMPGVLASGSQDGTIVLWDIKEGKEMKKWNAHAGGVEWVDFTPDGRVVSCGRDKLAKAWDHTGKNLFTSPPFGDIALRAALSADRVIAADWTGAIKVFAFEGAKPLGELTANPPPLATQLQTAQQRVAEATAAIEPLKQQLASLEQKLQAENTAIAEARSRAERAKKETSELTDKLAQQNSEIAKLREERAKQKEGTPEYAAANDKVQAKKAEITQIETALTAAKTASAAPEPTKSDADKQLATAKAAFDEGNAKLASVQAELGRWHRAQSYMGVHTARETYSTSKARHEDLLAEIKDAFLPIEQMKNTIATSEKRLAELPQKIQEAEAAAVQTLASVEALRKTAATTEAALKQKAEEAKSATDAHTKATAEVADLTKKHEAANKPVAAAQKAVDEVNANLAKRREERGKIANDAPEYAKADAKVQELKPKLAEATAKLEAENAKVAAAKTAMDEATSKQAAAKAQGDAASAEIPKLRESLDKTIVEVKAAGEKATVAEKTLATLRKEAESTAKNLAELRQKLPEETEAAKVAKAKAEQEVASLAAKLDGLKAQAERAKAEFETKYQSPNRSASADSLPPASKS